MPQAPCERLYRDNPFLASFQARLVTITPLDDGAEGLELDRTAFYPTGGGQPHDTGTLAGLPVIDVREAGDGRIVHVTPGTAGGLHPGEVVEGAIDWARRFDHMQQHTGQHILSRAMLRVAGAATRSFHLGKDSSTIDLDLPQPEEGALRRAEAQANAVITADAPVAVRLLPPEEAPRLAADDAVVRELALKPGDPIRLIAIGDFDETPCGGTHVRAAGQVGAILVRSWERFKGGTRVSFLCGGRVISEGARLASLIDQCGTRLSAPPDEVPAAIARLQDQLSEARRALKARSEAMAALECEALDRKASAAGAWRVIAESLPGRSMEELQRLARQYVDAPGRVALLASVDPGSRLGAVVFARSAAPVEGPRMGEILSAVCRAHGGKGGGGALMASGGGLPAEAVDPLLQDARRRLEGPEPS